MIKAKKVYNRRLAKDGMIKAVNESSKLLKEKYITSSNAGKIQSFKRVNRFIPGSIYTFEYFPETWKSLDFYDLRPIVMSIERRKTENGWIEVGINFNMLPPKYRMYILEILGKVFASRFDLNDKAMIAGKDPIPVFNQDKTIWDVLNKVLGEVGKTGFSFAIRHYKIDRIKNPKIIELEDWESVMFSEAKTLIGTSPGELQKIFEAWRKNHD